MPQSMLQYKKISFRFKGESFMTPEDFILEMAGCKECQAAMYKRMSITMLMGLYISHRDDVDQLDSWMIPFRDAIKRELEQNKVDIDALLKYMIENDRANLALFAASSWLKPKEGIGWGTFFINVSTDKKISPFVEDLDLDIFSVIVESFIFDYFKPAIMNISEIVGKEVFTYPTNQYGLTKVNGAQFKKDGLIFKGKGYYYNYFTNKTMLGPLDSTVGFAKIIQEEAGKCDIRYRLDDRLSMPEQEYRDYSGVAFAKFYGPQFRFEKTAVTAPKTIIVHIDENTLDKLLMVVKTCVDSHTGEDFWHIEIETLPHQTRYSENVITTFLHGMYYPRKGTFSHIDYTKNQYSHELYSQKYTDSQNGKPIDQYTEHRDLHYKIWCIENGDFSKETWHKLMLISLPPIYQKLLNEMLQ